MASTCKTRRISIIVAAVLLLTAQWALAGSRGEVRLKYYNRSPAKSVYLWHNGSYYGNVYTGQFNLKVDTDYAGTWGEGEAVVEMADARPHDVIGSFCADLAQRIPDRYTVYDVMMPEAAPIGGANAYTFPDGMGSTKASHLRHLFDNHHADADTSSTTAAAFQLAIWEIINENSGTYELSYYDGDRGSFYAKNSSSVALANDWLDEVVAETGVPDIALRILTDPCKQDYAVILPDVPEPPSNGAIPEPMTMLALIAGLGGTGGYLRRRRLPMAS